MIAGAPQKREMSLGGATGSTGATHQAHWPQRTCRWNRHRRAPDAIHSLVVLPLSKAYGWGNMKTDAPDRAVAGRLAAAALGHTPLAVRRFSTGSHHYVFEVTFEDRAPVVVRIAAEHSRSAMVGALKVSRLLRPLGVPLPEIISEGVNHHFSHLVLERLPGTDIGAVIGGLSNSSLEGIATKVAQAQQITSKALSGRRYGYSIEPANAPHERWSDVLFDNLSRSRRRIAAAKLFDEDAVDTVTKIVSAAHAELDALPPVPFSPRHYDQECYRHSRRIIFGNRRCGRPVLRRSTLRRCIDVSLSHRVRWSDRLRRCLDELG
jgi:hypothetical protein